MQPSKEILKRRKKWVDELRSEKYQQTTGALRKFENNEFSYCCLGVACDLVKQETGIGRWYLGDLFDYFEYDNEIRHGIPQNGIFRWLGHSNIPMIGERDVAILNDDGWTFAQIADAYEAEHIKPFEV